MSRKYRRYDLRLRNMVAQGLDLKLISHLNIPRTTLKSWIKKGTIEYITLEEFNSDYEHILRENLILGNELKHLKASDELLKKTIRIFGFQIQYQRLPKDESKSDILKAINKATESIDIKSALEIIGLSFSRYKSWIKRQIKCQLEDQSSCPRVSPNQLSCREINLIKDLFTSTKYFHYSILSLSIMAKRAGLVFASLPTWMKIIKTHKLKRNRFKYEHKNKIGIRAQRPNEIWHIDQTIIRLKNGTKAFLQVIVDNYSRVVLSWNVTQKYGGKTTKSLIDKALKSHQPEITPHLISDDGSENNNQNVKELINKKLITHSIAQIDIRQSNSMIESFFNRLKNKHLYFQDLETIEDVKNEVGFYVDELNNKIPLFVLRGATPSEAYQNQWNQTQWEDLKTQYRLSRKKRRADNLSQRCQPCAA